MSNRCCSSVPLIVLLSAGTLMGLKWDVEVPDAALMRRTGFGGSKSVAGRARERASTDVAVRPMQIAQPSELQPVPQLPARQAAPGAQIHALDAKCALAYGSCAACAGSALVVLPCIYCLV